VNPPDPDGAHPPDDDENVDINRSTASDRHSGHTRSVSAALIRRSNSNRFPHFSQRYS